MKGWTIFTHSVRLVFENLDMALRVSLLLYCVQAAFQIVSYMAMPAAVVPGQQFMLDPGSALQVFFLGIAAVVASLWIAVAWHRYVLLEERPEGWLPKWHGGKILGYLGRSMLIGLVISLAILVTMLIVMVIPMVQLLILPGIVLAGSYFFFRLGVMLPAGTVDQKLTIAESWTATKDKDGAIVVLAVIMMVGTFLLQVPTMLSGDQSSVITLIYNIVTGWFATMIGVSILTTLYGHYVQGRPIE
ncbi:hypothetical protein [Pacificoceanicola onchidii]|uniref:hypothetical protein n=1 Tax=Pacificoceanicola onchidii TaxID=2562685 RepID=UPI0010A6699E|nr:hypothetical protein [Pacificoceanicola onchidii]